MEEFDLDRIVDTAQTIGDTVKTVFTNQNVGRIVVGALKSVLPSVSIKTEIDLPFYKAKSEVNTKEINCKIADSRKDKEEI